jgi:hypothetical protein
MRWSAERGMILNSIISMMGGGLAVGPYTSAFSAEVISRGGSLTANELTYLNTFEVSVGSDLAEFDRLWIHGLSNNIAARTSFVNPSSTIITAVNSPTFTANQGYQGNGTTSYLNSNFIPSTQGVKYTLNSASYGVYSRTNSDISAVDFGSFNVSFTQARLRQGNIFYGDISSTGSAITFANTSSLGLHIVNRSGGVISLNKNGVQLATVGQAATTLSTINQYILARNQNGTADNFSSRQHALSFAGSGAINLTNFYNAVQALGTSIGWAV